MKSVLIVFGTRFGSTDEVAHEIAEVLERHNIETEVLNLRDGVDVPSLDEFEGIIVGSGVKMGRWTNEALNFMKNHQNDLNHKVLGMFVCSGEASNPNTYAEAYHKYLVQVMEKIGVKADMAEAFGGVFDFSSSSNYSFNEKKILQKIAKSDKSGFVVQDGKLNDFRNWQLIRNWAVDFSQLVELNNKKV